MKIGKEAPSRDHANAENHVITKEDDDNLCDGKQELVVASHLLRDTLIHGFS